MKKIVFTFMSCLIYLSCSNRMDIFEQALIYHSSKDNNHYFDLSMWISLDEDVFIKISPSNSNNIIKYLFERYPY